MLTKHEEKLAHELQTEIDKHAEAIHAALALMEVLGVDTKDYDIDDCEYSLAVMLEDTSIIIRKRLETPPVGAVKKCMICALEKEWGIFDPTTGAAVCVQCRDNARRFRYE